MINNQLIALINSLTKSEKRYFKINASLIKTNKMQLRMFDLLEKNKISSSDRVIKLLKISKKTNLTVIESRLQSLILKHLRGFHSNSSQGIELNNLLVEIEILYNKRLFKNCAKLILKAKKIATKYEHQLALLTILKWESYIEKEQGKYLLKSQTNLKEILKKEGELLTDYSKLIQFKHHTFNLLLLSKNKIVDDVDKEIKDYDKLITDKFFDITPSSSFDEKIFLLNFRGMYYMSKANFNKCHQQYLLLINEIENSDRKNILISNEYFFALNNLLLLQVMNNNFDNYNETLTKIYLQFENISAYNSLLFNVTQCYELGIYCEIGDVEKGLKLIPKIEKNLKKYDSETNEINKLLFYLNIAIINFFDNEYSKSIYWLNIFLNDYSIKKNDVTSNIYYYGHIINILVHFEAKNYESIDYLHNQCINNLKKIRKINKFDKVVLTFIKANSNYLVKSQKEQLNSFHQLKSTLTEIIKTPEESISLHFFDFFSWIDSHLNNVPIADLVRKKRLNQL